MSSDLSTLRDVVASHTRAMHRIADALETLTIAYLMENDQANWLGDHVELHTSLRARGLFAMGRDDVDDVVTGQYAARQRVTTDNRQATV